MGTRATRLTSKAITNAKPKEKDYVLSDGDGLQLRVRTNASRQPTNYHIKDFLGRLFSYLKALRIDITFRL